MQTNEFRLAWRWRYDWLVSPQRLGLDIRLESDDEGNRDLACIKIGVIV